MSHLPKDEKGVFILDCLEYCYPHAILKLSLIPLHIHIPWVKLSRSFFPLLHCCFFSLPCWQWQHFTRPVAVGSEGIRQAPNWEQVESHFKKLCHSEKHHFDPFST